MSLSPFEKECRAQEIARDRLLAKLKEASKGKALLDWLIDDNIDHEDEIFSVLENEDLCDLSIIDGIALAIATIILDDEMVEPHSVIGTIVGTAMTMVRFHTQSAAVKLVKKRFGEEAANEFDLAMDRLN